MKQTLCLLLALGLAFAGVTPAGGVTVVWQVPGDFSTIGAAMDYASSGDTILVGPGTYPEHVNFNWKAVSLQSTDGPEATIIHPNSGRCVDIMGDGAELIGFTLTNGHGDVGGGVQTQGSGSLIEGNIFDRNYQGTGAWGAAIGGNVSSPIIRRNIFRNHSTDTQWLAGVVSFVNGSSPIIENNLFVDNASTAIFLRLPSGANPQVTNNTIIRNRNGMVPGRGVYRNNIIVDNQTGVAANPSTFENNLVFGNGTDYVYTDYTGINGNISAAPMFVDPAGDFQLQWGSPAIDAGTSAGAPLVDLLNHPRPYDGDFNGVPAFDIGAYEAIPEPSTLILLSTGAAGFLAYVLRRRNPRRYRNHW